MIKKITQATALLVFATCSAFAQCMMIESPLADRAQRSQVIFEGKVISKNCFWNSEHTNIYTSNEIEVYKVFKGNISVEKTEVVTPGGVVGMEMELVTPSLELNVEDVGIFFGDYSTVLNSPSPVALNSRYEPFAGPQGFIKYNLAERIGQDAFKKYSNIENDVYAVISSVTAKPYTTINVFDINQSSASTHAKVSAAVISGFSPTSVTSGTLSQVTITGSGFGTTVGTLGFTNADDGGGSYINITSSSTNPPAANIVSWADAQIVAIVPYRVGTGYIQVTPSGGAIATSSTALIVPYGEISQSSNATGTYKEYKMKYANVNGKGGLTFTLNNVFRASAAGNTFERAAGTWRCEDYVDFEISPTTTTKQCTAKDGINSIAWDSTQSSSSNCVMSSNLLGITNSYFDACGSGGTYYWRLSEADIRFKTVPSGGSWWFGPANCPAGDYDLETIALHELGHAHLVAHDNTQNDVMYWARGTAAQIRTPATNDLAAGNDIMTRSPVADACKPKSSVTNLTDSVARLVPSASCELTTGIIEENSIHGQVSVYPNPSFTQVSFNFDNFDIAKDEIGMVICDPIGKEVLNLNKIESPVLTLKNNLPAGIYFYSILKNGRRVDSGKLVIAKM